MTMRNAFFASLLVVIGACVTQAAVTEVKISQPDNSSGGDPLSGFVTNDIVINFDGDDMGLGFQQMVLELDQGSIFQQDAFGENTPPNGALIDSFPDVAFDTFISVGGTIAADSEDVFEVGGAVNIVPGAEKKFDTEGLNITWQPALGVFLRDPLEDFMTARISLSDDAMGSFQYIGVGNSDAEASWWRGEGTIANGVMSLGGEPNPPVIGGVPGDVVDVFRGQTYELVVDAGDQDDDIDTWVAELVSGEPVIDATITPSGSATFSWDTTDSANGLYSWNIMATNSAGDTGMATLQVNVIPEPSTFALTGLALLGLIGCYARRK